MPANHRDFKYTMDQVKKLYLQESTLAEKEKRAKRGFNELIRLVVWPLRLPTDEQADLVHELAVFFGRRGGKAVRHEQVKKQKTPRPVQLRKGIKELVTSKPIELSIHLQLDMLNMSRQAHEDICPID